MLNNKNSIRIVVSILFFIVTFFSFNVHASECVTDSSVKRQSNLLEQKCNKYSSYKLNKTGLQPLHLAMDSDGNVFTGNIGNNTVSKILATGSSTIAFANTGNAPMDIAIDSNDTIFTVNSADGTITKILSNGLTTINYATVGSNPQSIVIDSQDNLYVGNLNSNSISKITPSGTTTVNFANTGIYGPVDLIVDSQDNLYATAGDTILKIDSTTGITTLLAVLNLSPIALAIDSTDNVYVLGYQLPSAYEVKIVTPTGTVIDWFSPIGSFAKDLALDSMDNVYVSISPNASNPGYVIKIDQSNTPTATILGITGNNPWGIITSPTGSVYTANVWSNSVTKL